jgi:hypothetical protein
MTSTSDDTRVVFTHGNCATTSADGRSLLCRPGALDARPHGDSQIRADVKCFTDSKVMSPAGFGGRSARLSLAESVTQRDRPVPRISPLRLGNWFKPAPPWLQCLERLNETRQ